MLSPVLGYSWLVFQEQLLDAVEYPQILLAALAVGTNNKVEEDILSTERTEKCVRSRFRQISPNKTSGTRETGGQPNFLRSRGR